jgi:lysozyme
MRTSGILASLLFCLAACTSSSGIEDLVPRPSMETTSSIPRPAAPVKASPSAQIASLAAPIATDDDDTSPPEPAALVEPGKPVAASLALIGPPPEKPATVARTFRRGVIHERRFRDAKPINFGKRSPKHLAVHGVDVSRWQGDIDWEKLRAQGANFVYIKATDGGDHIDPMFRKNWRNAADAGLRRGAYHFFYWCRVASEQADWFIRNVPRDANALPPVIDVEWNHESSCKRRPSRATVLEKMQVFMDRLERHYGKRPIIYTAPDFYRDNLQGAFPDYPFWLRSVAAHPAKVYPGRDWVFWQYSGSGLSHGVSGRIDLNAFNGDEGDWWAWLARIGGSSRMAQN